jgi:hypothetical protein
MTHIHTKEVAKYNLYLDGHQPGQKNTTALEENQYATI